MSKPLNQWEKHVDVDEIKEIRLASKVFFGCGAIKKIDDICQELADKDIKKIIVITGKNAYRATGAWGFCEKAFAKHDIEYVIFDKISPNPVATDVDAATKLGLDFNAKAVLAIGGGSPIDTAKSVAILMKHPDRTANELYEMEFTPQVAMPIIAINLTHGTGTECNRFAVVTIAEKNYKPAIAYDCIYPSYSIDDPNLCITLSPSQTLYTSIDAVNHVVEAATTTVASSISIEFAKRVIELVVKYLPIAMKDPKDRTARYWLMYASMIAGAAFDNGLLHFTHALEHPLSAVKPELSHGLGLAMILPAMIETIYNSRSDILNYILEPIKPDIISARDAAKTVEAWLFGLGVTDKLSDQGFTEADVPTLVGLVYHTPGLSGLVDVAPIDGTESAMTFIYKSSLKPMV